MEQISTIDVLPISTVKEIFKPVFGYIEVTKICNLRCISCPREEIVKKTGRPAGTISDENLEHLSANLPELKEIKFLGLGEPFLARDAASKFKAIKRLYPDVHLVTITNAAYSRDLNIEEILPYIDHLYISIDGHDETTFNSIRRKGDFKNLIYNANRIVKAKHKSLKISINSVFSLDNYMNMYQIIILAKALGIENVRFNLLQNWVSSQNNSSQTLQNIFPRMIDELSHAKVLEQVRKMLDYADVFQVKAEIIGNPDFTVKNCDWCTKMVYITEDGELLPCSMRVDQELSFGNIFKDGFESVWYSEKLQKFRQQKQSNDPPDICKDCPYVLNAPILKYLNEEINGKVKNDYLYHT